MIMINKKCEIKKKYPVLFGIFALLFAWNFIGLNPNLNPKMIKIDDPSSSTEHCKILLDGNTQLEAFVSGNGTDGSSLNPHIIENLVIEIGSDEVGIEIRNTTQYLIIENCTFNNHPLYIGDRGINLINCKNVVVTDCYAVNKSWSSICVFNSSSITLTNNVVCDNGESGIFMDHSNDSIIVNNNASHNLYYGIKMARSKNITVSGNIVHNNHLGCIHDHLGESNQIYNNNCIEGEIINFSVSGYNNVLLIITSILTFSFVFLKINYRIYGSTSAKLP